VFPEIESLAALAGGIVGMVLGLIGGGGSILAVPLLVYVVGVPSAHVAIGTSTIAVALSALANLAGHAVQGHVKWPCAIVFALAGTLGAVLGSMLGKEVESTQLLVLFGALMMSIAVVMLFKRNGEGDIGVRLTWLTAPALLPFLVFYGAGVGVLAGFFGIGGGFLVVPGLMAATGMPLANAIASSLVSVAAFGTATAGSYAASGYVDWQLVAYFVAGGIAGGIIGQFLGRRLGANKALLTHLFAAVIASVGAYMIWRGMA
jgi:hypothetical protein